MSSGLNLAQQEAVNYLHGPCLVLAGAGSGKTRVITHKIARLIQAGLEPKRIAAITFTNKAAAEMRERAKGLIGRDAKDVVVCTFHALGVRMMREDGAVLGLKPPFSILDSDDVTKHPEGRRRHHRRRHRAHLAVDHQQVEEHGPERRPGRGAGRGRQRAHHRAASWRATRSGWRPTRAWTSTT